MTLNQLKEVRQEAQRLLSRITELEARCKWEQTDNCLGTGCAETAAVRRASLDMTRALARLRKGK